MWSCWCGWRSSTRRVSISWRGGWVGRSGRRGGGRRGSRRSAGSRWGGCWWGGPRGGGRRGGGCGRRGAGARGRRPAVGEDGAGGGGGGRRGPQRRGRWEPREVALAVLAATALVVSPPLLVAGLALGVARSGWQRATAWQAVVAGGLL